MDTKIPQFSSTQADSADEHLLDVRGHDCPVPALAARRCLDGLLPGQVLKVLTTDPLAEMDLQILCDRLGHALLSTQELDDGLAILVCVSELRRADAE